MNVYDYLILALIAGLVVMAVRSEIKRRRTGVCGGSCASCTGGCRTCGRRMSEKDK